MTPQKQLDLLVEAIDKLAAFLERQLLEDRIAPHLVPSIRKGLNDAALIPRRKRRIVRREQ